MSFTFNWAGVQVPVAETKNNMKQSITDAGNFGRAARGFVVDQADKEYQGILNDYTQNQELSRRNVEALRAELAQLKARNEEIRQLIGG